MANKQIYLKVWAKEGYDIKRHSDGKGSMYNNTQMFAIYVYYDKTIIAGGDVNQKVAVGFVVHTKID